MFSWYNKNKFLTDIKDISGSDGDFLVHTGTAWTNESGATARTSIGLGTGNSPTFTGLDLSGITNGNIPYVSASGFADSVLNQSGSTLAIGTTTHTRLLHLHAASGGTMIHFTDNDSGQTATDGFDFQFENKNVFLRNREDGYIDFSTSGSSSRFRITQSGFLGFRETAPVTVIELTHTAPYITLHNSTEENGDGGRESRIIARGEQDGTEESVLGWLEFAHDGTSDDEKGRFQIMINDGNDALAPSILGLEIDSAGNIKAGTATISDNSGNLTSANGVASFTGAVASITITNGIVTAIS